MQKIIVTDVIPLPKYTICVTGLETNTLELITFKLTRNACDRLKITPGTILSGVFTLHDEQATFTDGNSLHSYQHLKFERKCNFSEFKFVLENSLCDSLEEGFNIILEDGKNCIPPEHNIETSIVTIVPKHKTVKIFRDKYADFLKCRLSFMDNYERQHKSFRIVDREFYNLFSLFKQKENIHNDDAIIDIINLLFYEEVEIYLRVGLTNFWAVPGEEKEYRWMIINGIYTSTTYNLPYADKIL